MTQNAKQNLKLTLAKQLPKMATNSNKNKQSLVVLVDDKKTILASELLTEQVERVNKIMSATNFKGKLTESVSCLGLAEGSMPLQVVGVGALDKLTATNLQKLAKAIYQNNQKQVNGLVVALGDVLTSEQFSQFALALLNASYRFDKYKSDSQPALLKKVVLVSELNVKAELAFVKAVHTGQNLTRNLANEPGNVCYPQHMAEQALALAKAYPDLLKVTVINQTKMAKLGMNCFLSVSKGSDREGKLVILEYYGQSKFKKSGNKADAPIALVGKGVTFDTGGISLKPGAGMDEMKFDMGGSASVIGTVKALCESRLPINVVSALACAENMPSARATRPGDVVTAMNGKTVEILNTDAEGRLVLCDTLCYVQKNYKPKAIIDVATLTGACVIALGSVRSAVYSKDEDLLFALENASEQAGDAIWHMPLDDEYQSQLDSPVADIQNIGGREAGSVTAACFLSRFVEEGQAWAHLDIAGTAWNSGKNKGATGRPVPLFMQYLKNMAEQK